ncbi:KIF13B [Symbiodinium pilosum]|uniref:KIF13B protein n=1 Tax=Symbiodinium pilosum TaxID=2952 RepID=A0A812NZZ8_SYMPI|nr:KIF13B [Symbiodinium pilosum]
MILVIVFTPGIPRNNPCSSPLQDEGSHQHFRLRIFQVADVDGSGSLSKAEVGTYLCRKEVTEKLQSLKLFVPDWLEIFDAMDADGDGGLSWAELSTAMQRIWTQLAGNEPAKTVADEQADCIDLGAASFSSLCRVVMSALDAVACEIQARNNASARAKELGEGGLAEMVAEILYVPEVFKIDIDEQVDAINWFWTWWRRPRLAKFELSQLANVISKGVDRYGHDSDYVKPKQFTFDPLDSVFKSTDPTAQEGSQAAVFQELGIPILENALDAYNGCIMAYGQTGSGKSYSVLGDPASERDQGLLPRACECLFEMISRQKQSVEKEGTPLQTAVLASYLEIYQEKMYDLLVNTRTDLQVRLHPALGPHVPGLIQSPVSTSKEVRELLDFGAKNRAVGATSMNANSSRSHAVFTLDIRLSYSGPQARDLQSRIHFVDLAGSEKQKKTHASGERLQEGIAINQSLSALSRVIQALAGTAGSGILPVFRESKLTLLLKDALSGNSRTVLLACISPARANFEETISTLEFAARCKLIKTNAKKNEQDKRELIETLSKEKQEVQDRLEAERQQKLLLQQELEREVEESKKNQDLAQKMQEEKQRIEEQLRSLQNAEQQLQLVKREQDDKAQEWDRLQRLNEEKEAELQQRLQQIDASHAETAVMERQLRELRELQERESRARAEEMRTMQEREQRQQQELERMQQKKAEALSQAERERQEAVEELQAKLQAVQQREEEERQRVEAARTLEAELRQRIEEEMKRSQNREEDLKRELQGLQSLSDSWTLKNTDIEKTAQEHKIFRERLLKELGISGMEHDVEDAQKVPRLVNMNPDPSLEGCLIYYLPLGETRIGADREQCHVCLAGLDVADLVCEIVNDDHQKLEVLPLPDGLVRVNGCQVVEDAQMLESGDRLAIGRAHIFRVVIPENSSAETAEEEDFETAMKELQANSQVDPRWRRGVDDAVMIVKRDYGTKEANLLLESAKAASEVVAEANAILKVVPQDWRNGVSHYELAVLFQADGFPTVCVVARSEDDPLPVLEQGTWQERGFSAGIWEAGRFWEDRLPLMHEAAELLQRRPTRCPVGIESFLDTAVDTAKDPSSELDWELQAFSEVELDTFQELSNKYKELQLAKKKKEEEERKQDAGPGILDFFFGARKRGPEESKDSKELVPTAPARLFEWLSGQLRSEKEPETGAAAAEKFKANAVKKVREKREASEPLKCRRPSMAPRGTLVAEAVAGGGYLEVPKSMVKRSSSSSTSSNRRATVAAKDASPKGEAWPAAEDLLEKFTSSPKDDIRIDVARLEAPIRRASKSGIEVVHREPSPSSPASPAQSPAQEDERLTVEILVKELFNEDKLGVRLRMEGLVVSNFDVPEAADVGWHFGDEIVAVNGRSVSTREEFRTVLANARKQLPITFTVKRQRPSLGRARRTVAGARPHTESTSLGPRDRAAKRKARASTSVPYRVKDTE